MRKNKYMNYLDKIPVLNERADLETDEKLNVTLKIKNKGIFNKIAQLILKKPKTSNIHLDALGSFVILQIDASKSIGEIARSVDKEFGNYAHPLYERLAKFFSALENCNIIYWK